MRFLIPRNLLRKLLQGRIFEGNFATPYNCPFGANARGVPAGESSAGCSSEIIFGLQIFQIERKIEDIGVGELSRRRLWFAWQRKGRLGNPAVSTPAAAAANPAPFTKRLRSIR
jgi:hypothetical protein